MTNGVRAESDHGFTFDQQGDAHGNTKGAPHGTSHTNCLAMERSALSAELGVYLGRGLRIPIHAGH
jgi:hypothetical protein